MKGTPDFSKSDWAIVAALVTVAIVAATAVIYAFGGFMFMLLWNWLMPHLWHAAPHLSWIQGIAVSWVLGILQAIFGRTTIAKSE